MDCSRQYNSIKYDDWDYDYSSCETYERKVWGLYNSFKKNMDSVVEIKEEDFNMPIDERVWTSNVYDIENGDSFLNYNEEFNDYCKECGLYDEYDYE